LYQATPASGRPRGGSGSPKKTAGESTPPPRTARLAGGPRSGRLPTVSREGRGRAAPAPKGSQACEQAAPRATGRRSGNTGPPPPGPPSGAGPGAGAATPTPGSTRQTRTGRRFASRLPPWEGRCKKRAAFCAGVQWSGRRDLNPRPSAWQADALPLSYTRPPPPIIRLRKVRPQRYRVPGGGWRNRQTRRT
jgi:hypothetical protein